MEGGVGAYSYADMTHIEVRRQTWDVILTYFIWEELSIFARASWPLSFREFSCPHLPWGSRRDKISGSYYLVKVCVCGEDLNAGAPACSASVLLPEPWSTEPVPCLTFWNEQRVREDIWWRLHSQALKYGANFTGSGETVPSIGGLCCYYGIQLLWGPLCLCKPRSLEQTSSAAFSFSLELELTPTFSPSFSLCFCACVLSGKGRLDFIPWHNSPAFPFLVSSSTRR